MTKMIFMLTTLMSLSAFAEVSEQYYECDGTEGLIQEVRITSDESGKVPVKISFDANGTYMNNNLGAIRSYSWYPQSYKITADNQIKSTIDKDDTKVSEMKDFRAGQIVQSKVSEDGVYDWFLAYVPTYYEPIGFNDSDTPTRQVMVYCVIDRSHDMCKKNKSIC